MVRFLLILAILLPLSYCSKKEKKPDGPNLTEEKIRLLRADADFSALSTEKGMKTAFMEYIDSNGVLLRPGHIPLVGVNAIDFLLQQTDTSYTLSWKPTSAFVSGQADMGYTYGIYALEPKNADTVLYGTYVSIWRKQQDGKWKFVLNSGNDGIEEPE
ncbi:MAG: hypothetical protein WAT19_13050 [Ferruginibacter sp.]